jgi:hypothetical protein
MKIKGPNQGPVETTQPLPPYKPYRLNGCPRLTEKTVRMTKIPILFLLSLLQAGLLSGATIHGFVREKDSLEPIISGNVWIRGTSIGTATNMKGHYVLASLPPGRYEVVFSAIGYRTEVREVTVGLSGDIQLDVTIQPEAILLKAMEVTADRERRELDIKPGQIAVQTPQLRTIPQIAEPDLFRSIQMLPGVATLSDFSAGLYIRGGSPDQNLILLDGIDVYNPNHLFGFFSTFNTDAVKSVELLKGGYPSMYGGRLSSVLNVYNKEGNRDRFHGVARVSLLSASTTLEGPWEHGSWMISGRRTYLELAEKIADFNLPYYFYDGHAKINFDIDRKNQASISFYAGQDRLDLKQDGSSIKLDWGNRTFSAQWTHLFSSRLFSHFLFAGSRFESDSGASFEDMELGIRNDITDLAFKASLTYSPSTRHSMDIGLEAKRLHFNLNYHIVDSDYLNGFRGNYASVFLQDNFKMTNLTLLQSGLRFDYYSDGGYFRFDPRISLKHLWTDRLNTTLSYGRFHQFLNLVQQGGMSFADMWFPVDRTFDPGRADHYIIGLEYDDKTRFSVQAEVYLKRYLNLAEYRVYRGADETLRNQTAAQNFLKGKGDAYGADIYVRNRFGRLEGWVGYSLCWTTKTVLGYNFGNEYYPNYDRRHTLTVIQDFRLGRKWRLNAAFKLGTGQPYTEATARYAAMSPSGAIQYKVLDGEKNFYRLPAYHRLDIGLFYETELFRLPAEIYLQAVNVYDHKNVWFREYDTFKNPAEVEDITMIPFVPTFGMSVQF